MNVTLDKNNIRNTSSMIDLENTKFTRNNKGEIDRVYELGCWYKFKTKEGVKFYKYLGVFYNIKDVPVENCIFVIGNALYMRNIDYNKFINSNLFNQGLQQKTKSDTKTDKDDQLLPTTPQEEDNLLLIMLKLLMKYRGLTENGFKKLFDSTSEMNNMKRLIFNGNGALSWQKFATMAEKLDADSVISVLDRNDQDKLIASNDNTNNE